MAGLPPAPPTGVGKGLQPGGRAMGHTRRDSRKQRQRAGGRVGIPAQAQAPIFCSAERTEFSPVSTADLTALWALLSCWASAALARVPQLGSLSQTILHSGRGQL